jgi:hypothetical protein
MCHLPVRQNCNLSRLARRNLLPKGKMQSTFYMLSHPANYKGKSSACQSPLGNPVLGGKLPVDLRENLAFK